eukprot:1157325-Pelagomonas_calceolata.AAC.5
MPACPLQRLCRRVEVMRQATFLKRACFKTHAHASCPRHSCRHSLVASCPCSLLFSSLMHAKPCLFQADHSLNPQPPSQSKHLPFLYSLVHAKPCLFQADPSLNPQPPSQSKHLPFLYLPACPGGCAPGGQLGVCVLAAPACGGRSGQQQQRRRAGSCAAAVQGPAGEGLACMRACAQIISGIVCGREGNGGDDPLHALRPGDPPRTSVSSMQSHCPPPSSPPPSSSSSSSSSSLMAAWHAYTQLSASERRSRSDATPESHTRQLKALQAALAQCKEAAAAMLSSGLSTGEEALFARHLRHPCIFEGR